jgi:hypothetical protein
VTGQPTRTIAGSPIGQWAVRVAGTIAIAAWRPQRPGGQPRDCPALAAATVTQRASTVSANLPADMVGDLDPEMTISTESRPGITVREGRR